MLLFLAPPPPDRSLVTLISEWRSDFATFFHYDLFRILTILFIGFLLQRIIRFFFDRMGRIAGLPATSAQRSAQLRTLGAILRATTYSVLGFLILLRILSVFSINLTPLLASAGVVGVGIGLGAQSLFKDIINGVFILIENQYNVGEVVKVAGLQGTVEDLTLRATRLRDADGTLYIVPNSQIATVSNLSRDFAVAALTVSVDATADPDKVIASLQRIAAAVHSDPAFATLATAPPDVPGIDRINGREVLYPVSIRVRANQRDPILRELRRRIIQTFEREGIPLGSDASMLILPHSPDPTAPPPQHPLINS